MNDSFHLKEGERILSDVTSRVIGPDVTALLACMCIFFSESTRQHLFMSPRVGMTFSGHPGIRISLRGIGNLSI